MSELPFCECGECGLKVKKKGNRFINGHNRKGKKMALKRITKICRWCGSKFEVQPSRSEDAKFCSKVCSHKSKSVTTKGNLSFRYKAREIRTCKYCNKDYEVIFTSTRQFCSRKCYGKWQSENLIGKNGKAYKGKIKKICEYCGNTFLTYPSLSRLRFCSVLCSSKWQSENKSGENSPNWQGGLSYGKYCEKFNDEFKEKIRDLFGQRCFICGITEEENNEKLSVHHVNYDKKCLCSSNCEFVPVCRSCHMKTGRNRRYWEDLIMCHLYPDRITMVDL